MRNFKYFITDEVGIHARPAGMLVKEVKKYKSKVMISKEGKSAEATKLMAVMGLGIKCGQSITVEISGEDEEEACEALQKFFEENL